MKRKISITAMLCILLMFLEGSSIVFGTVTEVNIVVNPQISHTYEKRTMTGSSTLYDYIEDSVEIDLPNCALASGDVYRINLSFLDEISLKIINEATILSIMPRCSSNELGSSGMTSSDSVIRLDMTSYYNIINPTKSRSSNFWNNYQTDEYEIRDHFSWYRDRGEITDGSLISGIRIEFTLPTIYEGAVVPLTEYNYNNLFIKSYLYGQNHDDVRFIEVVPEPSSFLLFGLIALTGRQFARRRT
jgi:hypothetical protein